MGRFSIQNERGNVHDHPGAPFAFDQGFSLTHLQAIFEHKVIVDRLHANVIKNRARATTLALYLFAPYFLSDITLASLDHIWKIRRCHSVRASLVQLLAPSKSHESPYFIAMRKVRDAHLVGLL